MGVLTSSQLTFQKLTDAYSMHVSPDCIALNCDKDGKTTNNQTVTINFGTYLGTQRIATASGDRIVINNLPDGVTIESKSNSTASQDGNIVIKIAAGTTLGNSLTASFKISVIIDDAEKFVMEKYITMIKSVVGATGSSGKMYWIDCDVSSIKRSIGGDYTPSEMTIITKIRSEESGATLYPCYIKIEESNGIEYSQKYFSASIENTKKYAPSDKTIYDTDNGVEVTSKYYDINGENLTINNVTDADGVKAIRISMYDAEDNTKLLDQKVIPVVTDGQIGADGEKGDPGESTVVFAIYSPDGDTFRNHTGEITLHTYAYDGANSITDCSYKWYKNTPSGWEVILEKTASSLLVTAEDVPNVQTYKCTMTYDGKEYSEYYTLRDMSDIYRSEIKTINGNMLNSNQNYSIAYIALYENEVEIDPLVADIWLGNDTPIEGDYYLFDKTNYTINMKHFDGLIWTDIDKQQKYQYNWSKIINNNSYSPIDMQSKIVVLTSQHIIGATTIEGTISDNEKILSKCQLNFIDLNDPIVGTIPPSAPSVGQLWVDTTSYPYVIKVYNGSEWEPIQAYNDTNTNIFTEKPDKQLSDGNCYRKGDLWIVGEDYCDMTIDNGGFPYSVKTMLICINTNFEYSTDDWEDLSLYNQKMKDLEERTSKIEDHVRVDPDDGDLYLIGTNIDTGLEKFYARLSSQELGFYERNEGQGNNEQGTKVTWIGNSNMHAKETVVESALAILKPSEAASYNLKNSGNPFLQIGNFKVQIESNGSLSIMLA